MLLVVDPLLNFRPRGNRNLASKGLSINYVSYREPLAGSVIQATGMVEFEDGLWTEASGALGAAASILESIPNPPRGKGWSWVGCGCHKFPFF